MIYFLHAPDYKLIKIGYSTNVKKRIAALKGNMPFIKLKCLKIIDGDPWHEKKLHYDFRDLQFKDRSEWFKAEGKLLSFIFDKSTTENYDMNIFIASIFPHGYCAKLLKNQLNN